MQEPSKKDLFSVATALAGVVCFSIFLNLYYDDISAATKSSMETGPVDKVFERGKRMARNCVACHDMTSARRFNRVGPPLWGIVGQRAGSIPGYSYSKAHLDRASETTPLVWDEATLDIYLANPKAFIPGNKMAFAGMRDQYDRQSLIQFLKTLRSEDRASIWSTLFAT